MKNAKRFMPVLAALAAAWMFVSPAAAQPQPAPKEPAQPAASPERKGGPCQDDMQKFCKDAGDRAARMKCMKEHDAELSEPCRRMRENIKARVGKRLEKAKEACSAEIDRFCKDVPEGEGRVAKCLKGHAEELGPRCKIVYDRIDIQVQKRKLRQEKRAAMSEPAAPKAEPVQKKP
ncbi:MAG: cysteine rich repeat-containing protein [Elusimicrobia bacterium]|nr:cysteine rich repeat-containing protein [Elusimicrobiota bacterium]